MSDGSIADVIPIDRARRLEVIDRPKKRGDCAEGGAMHVRPCPWASCRHSLVAHYNPHDRTVDEPFADVEHETLADTCALDVADRGDHSQEEVAERMGVCHQRVDAIERGALSKRKELFRRITLGLGVDRECEEIEAQQAAAIDRINGVAPLREGRCAWCEGKLSKEQVRRRYVFCSRRCGSLGSAGNFSLPRP